MHTLRPSRAHPRLFRLETAAIGTVTNMDTDMDRDAGRDTSRNTSRATAGTPAGTLRAHASHPSVYHPVEHHVSRPTTRLQVVGSMAPQDPPSLEAGTIFAAGDIASVAGHSRPKAGVFAVMAGMVLSINLRAALRGEPLVTYWPQTSFLGLLGLGDGGCIASRGALATEGRWLWELKDPGPLSARRLLPDPRRRAALGRVDQGGDHHTHRRSAQCFTLGRQRPGCTRATCRGACSGGSARDARSHYFMCCNLRGVLHAVGDTAHEELLGLRHYGFGPSAAMRSGSPPTDGGVVALPLSPRQLARAGGRCPAHIVIAVYVYLAARFAWSDALRTSALQSAAR